MRWDEIKGFPSGESSLRHHGEFQRITWKRMGLDKARAAGDTMPMYIGMGDLAIYFTSLELMWRNGIVGSCLG